jgi:hypothetical protein
LDVEYGVLGSRRMDCIAAREAASDRAIASQRWTFGVLFFPESDGCLVALAVFKTAVGWQQPG